MRTPLLILLIALAVPVGAEVPDASSHIRRGEKYLSAGSADKALREFKEAKKLAAGPCEACEWGLARAWHSLGKRKEALASCAAIATSAATPEARIRALNLKAIIQGTVGSSRESMDEAEVTYRELIGLVPGEANLAYNLALLLFRKGDEQGGAKELERYLDLAPDGEMALPARRILEKPTLASKQFAPDFSIEDRDGRKWSQAELRGRIVVLDFWATWCGPCIASIPELRTLTEKYPEERLVLISISVDEDRAEWERVISKKKMTWPQSLDSRQSLRKLFRVRAYPTYLVIDGDGVFVARFEGQNQYQSIAGRLKHALGKALDGPR